MTKKELIVENDPKSPISEIYRTLRTNIQFMSSKDHLKALLVTSTIPGEGKSWVSSNLAVTFAQAGKKVILLDADMRLGRQYSIFGVSPIPGLSNYLSGIYDDYYSNDDLSRYLQKTTVKNLYVIPSGNVPPNPSELLASEYMINLVDRLKNVCDILIVDGPPTSIVSDPLIISRIVDSTIVVVANNKTKRDALKKVIDNIQNIGGKVSGIVMNMAEVSTKKYEHSYYYGSTKSTKNRKKIEEAEKAAQNATVKMQQENKNINVNQNNIQNNKNPMPNTNNMQNIPNIPNMQTQINRVPNEQPKINQNIINNEQNNIINEVKKEENNDEIIGKLAVQEERQNRNREVEQDQDPTELLKNRSGERMDTKKEINSILSQINSYLKEENKNK